MRQPIASDLVGPAEVAPSMGLAFIAHYHEVEKIRSDMRWKSSGMRFTGGERKHRKMPCITVQGRYVLFAVPLRSMLISVILAHPRLRGNVCSCSAVPRILRRNRIRGSTDHGFFPVQPRPIVRRSAGSRDRPNDCTFRGHCKR